MTVNAGQVNLTGYANDPTNTLTVNSGGVLYFGTPGVNFYAGGLPFGPGVGQTAAVPLTPIVINAGGLLSSANFNYTMPLGPLTLAGGTYNTGSSQNGAGPYPSAPPTS